MYNHTPMRIILLVFLIFLNPLCSDAQKIKNVETQSTDLVFIENKGQITDQYANTRTDIDFKLKADNGLSIFIGKGALYYQWSKKDPKFYIQNSVPGFADSQVRTETYRIDVELLAANNGAECVAEEEQSYTEHYYTAPFSPARGGCVHSYKRIIYKNIYPNIDWVIYINKVSEAGMMTEDLEYDFVLHPGAKIGDIQIRYNGAQQLIQLADGSISAVCPMGSISEKAPNTYTQDGHEALASKFLLKDNVLSFTVDSRKVDGGTSIVIDPSLHWATYYGGSGEDNISRIACDANGGIYVCGTSTSGSNIATLGAYQGSYMGGNDAYIAKFSTAGSLIWATYYGGSGQDGAAAVACDAWGYLYVAGGTQSSSNIASPGAYQGIFGGFADAFIAKFDSSGSLLWASYFGGDTLDSGYGVCTDALGNVYICGRTQSSSQIAGIGAQQAVFGGVDDAFLAKFSGSGSLLWATYYGGSGSDKGNNIACDAQGNVYMTGPTNSNNNIITPLAWQTTFFGYDAFLVKFNSAGNRLWATYYGGNGNDEASGICTDASGNIYISGLTTSSNNIAGSTAWQSSPNGIMNCFLARFDKAGQRQWGTYYGGNSAYSDFEFVGIAVHGTGHIYVALRAAHSSGVASSNAYQSSLAGTENADLAEFDANGQRTWGSYFGTGGTVRSTDVAIDATGYINLCGQVFGPAGSIYTQNAHQAGSGGADDGFLAQFFIDTLVSLGSGFYDTLFCAGDTFSVACTVSDTFGAANIFNVQLSDSSGDFSAATIIGTSTTSLGATIHCSIPGNIPNGSGYRLRITASSPADTSDPDRLNIHIINVTNLFAGSNSPLCVGDSLLLHAIDSVADVSWQWTGPNGFYDTLANTHRAPTVQADSGNYVVTAALEGCTAKDTIHVMIKPRPAMPIAGSNSSLCTGDTLKLTVNNWQSGTFYSWDGANSFTSSIYDPIRVNVILADSGKYKVSASLNGCTSGTDTINVIINSSQVPAVNITSQPTMVIPLHTDTFTAHASSCPNPAYQWYRNGVPVIGATSNVYITSLFNGDHISVVIHCNGPCTYPDSAQSNTVTTGVTGSQILITNIIVHPNPSTGLLFIDADQKIQVRLLSIDGREVLSRAELNCIDISRLPQGIYLLQVYSTDAVLLKIEKIVKQGL